MTALNMLSIYGFVEPVPTGVNFINVLHAAFASAEPNSIKKTVKSSVFLHFWDLRAQKLHVNMLVKLTPGDDVGEYEDLSELMRKRQISSLIFSERD